MSVFAVVGFTWRWAVVPSARHGRMADEQGSIAMRAFVTGLLSVALTNHQTGVDDAAKVILKIYLRFVSWGTSIDSNRRGIGGAAIARGWTNWCRCVRGDCEEKHRWEVEERLQVRVRAHEGARQASVDGGRVGGGLSEKTMSCHHVIFQL